MNEPYTPFEPRSGGPRHDENSPTGTEPTKPSVKFDSGETHTHKSTTDDLKTAAHATADKYRGKAEQAWGNAQERAQSFQKKIEQEVREKPTKAIFTLLGIGFLLGLIFRRR